MIKVLIVEDSPTSQALLNKIFESSGSIEVVGIASDGYQAISMAKRLTPDVITMDIHMPNLDGLETTKQIMLKSPVPILIVTKTVDKNMQIVFKMLNAGAMDVTSTPALAELDKNSRMSASVLLSTGAELLHKIRIISQLKRVMSEKKARLSETDEFIDLYKNKSKKNAPLITLTNEDRSEGAGFIIAIGASTGGPRLIAKILSDIPKDFPAGILIVQHMEEGFTKGFAEWLDSISPLNVREATQRDTVRPGEALVAPGNRHIFALPRGRIELKASERVSGHRPSADVLFSSVAENYGSNSIGIILSGMGEDGAAGLKKMRESNAKTIAQNEKTCVVFGMPKAAIDINAAQKILPIENIAREVLLMIKN